MFRKDTHSEEFFWDPWSHLGPKRRRNLEQDWPGVMRRYVLEHLPLKAFETFFHPTMGRPTKDQRTILGALVLQQTLDLSDEQTVKALAYDVQWHYALDLADDSDDSRVISERTLWQYRRMAEQRELSSGMFRGITDGLIEGFGVDVARQRLDSTHFLSNMRQLNRAQLLTQVIVGFLRRLKKDHPECCEQRIDVRMQEEYLKTKAGGCFGIEPGKAGQRLEKLGEDLWVLVKLFEGDEGVSGMRTYQHLVRVLREQCEVIEAPGEAPRLRIKEPKDVGGDSLQNPSDEDATYNGHKGSGYQMQIMETYREEDSKRKDATVPDLITLVEVQGAHESDMKMVARVLQESEEGGYQPERLLADGGYGSDANDHQAAQADVELVSPSNRGKPKQDATPVGLEGFSFNEQGEVRRCPAGKAPVKTGRTKKGNYRTCFDRQVCLHCEQKGNCGVVLSGSGASLPAYDAKKRRLGERRAEERTEAFKSKYRWRAGVEGTHSRLKQQFGLKRLRVRGMSAVRFASELKALGMNIFRCAKALKARQGRFLSPHFICRLHEWLLSGWGGVQ